MRGAHRKTSYIPQPMGIIPADAGSTDIQVNYSLDPEDHPRGCGEHELEHMFTITVTGSSPRMRGALSKNLEEIYPWRIIPADAGSTECTHLSYLTNEDHPRGCGEHRLYPGYCPLPVGSSPRMRGAPL